MLQTHIFKANHRPTGKTLNVFCGVCVWTVVKAPKSERKERLGVSNVKSRHLVASSVPSISACSSAPFIFQVMPRAFRSERKIKAERYDSAVGYVGLLYVEQDSVTHRACQSQP